MPRRSASGRRRAGGTTPGLHAPEVESNGSTFPQPSGSRSPLRIVPQSACGPLFAPRPVSPHRVEKRRRKPRVGTRCNGKNPHRSPVLRGAGRLPDGPTSRLSVVRHRSLKTFRCNGRHECRFPHCLRSDPHARPIPPANRANQGRQGGGDTGPRPRCREKNMSNRAPTLAVRNGRVRWAEVLIARGANPGNPGKGRGT